MNVKGASEIFLLFFGNGVRGRGREQFWREGECIAKYPKPGPSAITTTAHTNSGFSIPWVGFPELWLICDLRRVGQISMNPFLQWGQGMNGFWEIMGETTRARNLGHEGMKTGDAETSMSDSWRVLPK